MHAPLLGLGRRMRRPGFNAPKVGLLLGVGLLCFGLGELVVRGLFGDRIVIYPRFHARAEYDGFTLRRLEPGTSFVHTSIDGEWEFRINSQGFRDDENYGFGRSEGVVRVLSLGDSHTQGFEVRQEKPSPRSSNAVSEPREFQARC